jgi:hypothetical protein
MTTYLIRDARRGSVGHCNQHLAEEQARTGLWDDNVNVSPSKRWTPERRCVVGLLLRLMGTPWERAMGTDRECQCRVWKAKRLGFATDTPANTSHDRRFPLFPSPHPLDDQLQWGKWAPFAHYHKLVTSVAPLGGLSRSVHTCKPANSRCGGVRWNSGRTGAGRGLARVSCPWDPATLAARP